MWSSRLKVINEINKITNILKFQLKNTIKKSNDVNIITKCHEYFINKEKTRLTSINKKK
jgi:hypothetical protein